MFKDSSKTSRTTGNYILGINIDSDEVLLVYGSPSGTASETLSFSAPKNESFQTMLSEISTHVDRLLMITQAQWLPLPDVVSVSTCGNFDAKTGLLTSSADFPLWKNEALPSQMQLRLNLPVHVERKADAGLLAELLFGSLSSQEQSVYLSFQPRIRAALFSDGKLYSSVGGISGALGHMQLLSPEFKDLSGFDDLNDIASASGLLKLAKLRQPSHWEDQLTIAGLIEAANSGDPYALEIVDEAAQIFGSQLPSLIHMLRPTNLLVGYPFNLLGDAWLKPMSDAIANSTGLGKSQLPHFSLSSLANRQPELEAIAPAVYALRVLSKH